MTIETDRLLITEFTSDHLNQFLNIYSKKEVMHFIGNGKFSWNRQELLNRLLQFKVNTLFNIHSVLLKNTSQIIGEFSVFNSFNSNTQVEVGYILDSKFWDKGYATEMLKATINELKKNMNVEHIIARIDEMNQPSINLIVKIGFTLIEKQIVNNKTRCSYSI